jgi:hypothetical protein
MTATCVCCSETIASASKRFLAAHSACWQTAGGRILAVPPALVRSHLRAELEAWRRDYEQAERQLIVQGWLA